MGIDKANMACLGIRLPWEVIQKKTLSIVRSCDCDFTTNLRFCGNCGKEIKDIKRYEYEYFPYVRDDDEGNLYIDSWELREDVIGWTFPKFVYLGINIKSEEGCPGFKALDYRDMEEVRSELEATLEPLGLFDEGAFGLHCYTRIS